MKTCSQIIGVKGQRGQGAQEVTAVQTVGRRNFRQLASSAWFPGRRTSFGAEGASTLIFCRLTVFLQADSVVTWVYQPKIGCAEDPGGPYPEGALR